MDLVKEGEQRRLAALERVVEATRADHAEPSGLPLPLLLTSGAALLAALLGALWLLS